MKKLFASLILLLTAVILHATDFKYGTLYYTIISETDRTCMLRAGNKTASGNMSYSEMLIIPSEAIYQSKSYTVIGIKEYSFNKNTGLRGVVIPESVTNIYEYAFYGCEHLYFVSIPSTVRSIGNYAFKNCPIRTLEIDCLNIGNWFKNNEFIETVAIGNSAETIGADAFYGCSKLSELTIGNSVTTIRSGAFANCPRLKTVSINNPGAQILSNAFYNTDVSNVYSYSTTPPECIEGAFNYHGTLYVPAEGYDEYSTATEWEKFNIIRMYGTLDKMRLDKYVAKIAVGNTLQLNAICLDSENKDSALTWTSSNEDVATVSEDGLVSTVWEGNASITASRGDAYVTCEIEVYKKPFLYNGVIYDVTSYENKTCKVAPGNDSCVDVTIPEQAVYNGVSYTVTEIDDLAFSGNDKLTAVSIPNTVTVIGKQSFKNCTKLTSIKIPCSTETIGYGAFFNCLNLSTVDIPNTVTDIGFDAFYSCPITELKIDCYEIGTWFKNFKSIKTITLGNSVLSIASKAFEKCSGLTSINIPASLKSIGSSAFQDCAGLTKVEFDDVESICNITFSNIYSNPLYYAKKPYINNAFISDITIPSSVKTIGQYSFAGCSLASLIIPATVTSVGDGAFTSCSIDSVDINCKEIDSWFYECIALDKVKLGDSVKTIRAMAFSNCSLSSLDIRPSDVSINSNAFASCQTKSLSINCEKIGSWFSGSTKLEKVALGDSVKTIENFAFSGCSALADLTIGKSVSTIGNSAFEKCPLTILDIPLSVKTIGSKAFSGCPLTTLSIPSSLTSIGTDAFALCPIKELNIDCEKIGPWFKGFTSLEKVEFGKSVKFIENFAFSDCTGLSLLDIGKSVISIGESAFRGCSKMVGVSIPASVMAIGADAFYGCTKLSMGYVDYADIESLCNIKFANEYSNPLRLAHRLSVGWNLTNKVEIPSNVTSIGQYAFSGCSLTLIDIPSTATTIEPDAFLESSVDSIIIDCKEIEPWFKGCKSLQTVTIGDSATAIGDSAFDGCTKLKTLNIGRSVTSIGSMAFSGCPLTTLSISSSVTSIGTDAFASCPIKELTIDCKEIGPWFENCTTLEKVTFGNSVTSIGSKAFSGCPLYLLNIPSSVTSIETDAFASCPIKELTIDCKEIGTWFKDCATLEKVTFGNSVTSIGSKAFSGCPLATLSISSSVTSIETDAFASCPIKELTIDCKEIKPWFRYCTTLQKVTFGNSVTSIGELAFRDCEKLESVYISPNVKTIGRDAFVGCFGIKRAEFASIESLCGISFATKGSNIFHGDTYLYIDGEPVVDVIIPSSVSVIGNYAFYSYYKLNSLTISDAVTQIGNRTFEFCMGLETVSLGKSVSTIGDGAFSHCSSLKDFYSLSEIPPTCGSYIFQLNFYPPDFDCIKSCTLYVPAISYKKYKNADTWEHFFKIERIGSAISEIILDQNTVNMNIGDDFQITAKILPAEASDEELIWSSSNEKVATVSATGLVKAVSPGTTTITVVGGNVTATCTVIVSENSGIDDVLLDGEQKVEVYNLQGIRLDVSTREELKQLISGIYIINGKKVYLK